ncbi:MAG: UDP-3-O-acyl-N-acetylglucosamine deacetylase [Parvularculaceae bacterium]
MRVQEQTTLARIATASGVALHSGVETKIVLRPAGAGTGIVFWRMDLRDAADARPAVIDAAIKAHPNNVAEARYGVRLANAAGASVMTVEHLMAAFALCEIDNAVVEVYGPEIPAFDGSTAPIIELLDQAGVKPLAAAREAIEVRALVRIEDGDRFVEVSPADGRFVEVTIDFSAAAIGRQSISFALEDAACPVERLAAARTFCRLQDVETMRAAGFCRGGTLENAVVVDGDRLLNPAGLRDSEEFVLHKALDLIGDLYLLGAPLFGRVRAHKPGHDLNTRLAQRLAADLASVERRVIPHDEERRLLSA